MRLECTSFGLTLFSKGFCSSILRKTYCAISWPSFFKIQILTLPGLQTLQLNPWQCQNLNFEKSARLWQNAADDVAQGVWSSHRAQLNRVKRYSRCLLRYGILIKMLKRIWFRFSEMGKWYVEALNEVPYFCYYKTLLNRRRSWIEDAPKALAY